MPITNAKDMIIAMLSELRNGAERSLKIYEEMGSAAQNPQIKEALDALSRAAKMDPDNAEIQNYLGLALSEKGMRGPAETALRRAVQLQPNYGGAHYNLAIVYSSQQPPAMELARFHYQKAITSGHAPNKELEQKLGRN